MDCVYYAFCDYMKWWHSPCDRIDKLIYRVLKISTHGIATQGTFAGIVPLIITVLATMHNMRTIEIEHQIFTKDHYLYSAKNGIQRHIVEQTDFGLQVERFTLSPAIYLTLENRHAQFWADILETNTPIMALKISR